MSALIRLLCLVVLVSACHTTKEESTSVPLKNTASLTDVKKEKAPPVHRIISIGHPITDVVLALGDSAKLVAQDRTHPRYPLLNTEKVGYDNLLRAEYILQYKPDVVLTEEEGAPLEVFRKVRDKNIPFFRFSNHFRIDSLKSQIDQIAYLLNREEEANALKDSLDYYQEKVQEILKEQKDTARVVYVHARGPRIILASGPLTSMHALIELAGGENAVQSFDGLEMLTVEDMQELNPDFLIMSQQSWDSFDGKPYMATVLTSSTAYRLGKVIFLDEYELMHYGIHSPKTAYEIAQKLYKQSYYNPLPYYPPNYTPPSQRPAPVRELEIVGNRSNSSGNAN